MSSHSRRARRGPWLLPTLILPSVLIGLSVQAGQPPAPARPGDPSPTAPGANAMFARDNLIAWCIVPFDSKKRSPEERAAMLEKLGFKHFAYDRRGEHIPPFDAEGDALKKHGVSLGSWWVAPVIQSKESMINLDVLNRHNVK